MEFRPNRKAKGVMAEVTRANDLMERGRWNDAREIFVRGRAFARERGLPYGTLAWGLCICLDNMGQLEDAFRMAVEAVDQEPLDPRIRDSLSIVAGRIAEVIEERNDLRTVPTLYGLLVENDAAETRTHVAMARHLVHVGDSAAAGELLESVTTLSPNCGDAWRLRAQLVRSQGLEEEASRMEIEAMACENAVAAAVEARSPVEERIS